MGKVIQDFSSKNLNSLCSQMFLKCSGSKGRRSVAVRKIKQVWRRKKKPYPPWTELPGDITANILHRLGAIEILENAQKVCTTWRSVCKDPTLWTIIDMPNNGDLYMSNELEEMCCQAVDRSQGQLVDINLEYFASQYLLDYIASRSKKVKRLRIASCDDLSDNGLIEAIKGFSKLEELHIILTPMNNNTVEMVGRSCPLLRSFSFNKIPSRFKRDISDEDAFAIARSMPELRHLELLGNCLTNVGVAAIIDSCSHLETLDLSGCEHVTDMADVEKRFSIIKIKCLSYPDESTLDNEYVDDDHERIGGYSYGLADSDHDSDYYYDQNYDPEEYYHYFHGWDD